MLPDVRDEVDNQPWPGADGEHPRRTAERRIAMRQVLERYVTGNALLIRRDIKELGSDPVRPHMRGYWEFRSQGRMEETRLFGFFARPGAFVATAFKGRGTFGSQSDWDTQHAACEARWNQLTGGAAYMTEPWPVQLRRELDVYLNVIE